MDGDTHTDACTRARAHTRQQDFSPTHIPKQNTLCNFTFVFFSLLPAISASTSHIGSLIPTLVLTSVIRPPITLWFLAFAAVQKKNFCLHFAKHECLFQVFRLFWTIQHNNTYDQQVQWCWRACVDNYIVASFNPQSDNIALIMTADFVASLDTTPS